MKKQKKKKERLERVRMGACCVGAAGELASVCTHNDEWASAANQT